MNEKLTDVLAGITIGLIISSLVAVTYSINNAADDSDNEDVEFSMESSAYLDESTCPNYSFDRLVGLWKGREAYPDSNSIQEWLVNREADGTFTIEFTIKYSEGDEYKSVEKGLWAYSGCLYSVIVREIDDSAVIYQEVYRVNSLDDVSMKYINYRTGSDFEIFRIEP